ncbi:MAG TPA: dTDP-4-dehydrorhamnose reductase [Terriglobales bacterium]|nr:dTDP-4-dehydrorhamnose reductase [Terriglobales bacterium]
MKVLLIGANGQLGTDLLRVFQAAGHDVLPFTRRELDICHGQQLAAVLREAQPAIVLNTAAFHKVEECERKPDLAFQVNGSAVMNLALACKDADAILVHFSTDYVFGGYAQNKPYEVDDRPAPLNVYGVSKLVGEHLIAFNLERYFVIRTCGLYGIAGSSGKGGNFVENMLKKAMAGEPIRVVDDQVLTPTYTADLAESVSKLVFTGRFGLYHLSSEGQCSWYEFTRGILQYAGIHAKLSPVKTGDFFSSVKRPTYSVLSKAKFHSLGLSIPPWQDALSRYLDDRKRNLSAERPVMV